MTEGKGRGAKTADVAKDDIVAYTSIRVDPTCHDMPTATRNSGFTLKCNYPESRKIAPNYLLGTNLCKSAAIDKNLACIDALPTAGAPPASPRPLSTTLFAFLLHAAELVLQSRLGQRLRRGVSRAYSALVARRKGQRCL
jgi:hypothetical protein